ncbi:MAG: integrin alpha, partial [Planctomycetota bacterium]
MFPRTARSLSRIPRPALWAIAASFTAPFVASQATQVWEVSEVNNRLGAAIDAGHDVNGDGVPDVIVGVPGGDENGVPTGRARVLSGTNGS